MRLSEQGTTAELKKLSLKYYDALVEIRELTAENTKLREQLANAMGKEDSGDE